MITKGTLFITGTDTGVGKTLLTGLLLSHLRSAGRSALAMKPFCSGSEADVTLLNSLQDGLLPRRLINPFFFPEPVAPWISARLHRRRIKLSRALEAIHAAQPLCDLLLVEGAGGVYVPLSASETVLDLIRALNCPVLIVAKNKLGAINHTILTAHALSNAGLLKLKVVLMQPWTHTLATRANGLAIRTFLRPLHVVEIPHLGARVSTARSIRRQAAGLKSILNECLNSATFAAPVVEGGSWSDSAREIA